jgi:hypothetical protein
MTPFAVPPLRRASAVAVATGLALLGGCQALRTGDKSAVAEPLEVKAPQPMPTPALPGKHSLRVSQYVFNADFELKPDQPLFKELSDLREQVQHDLQLPPATALVQVYLFEDRERYERFMRARYPELPKRRAFFVAQPRAVGGADDLLVYTFWGDRIRQDLRHELTHALLHGVLKDVPLWLDEGLAEFFELPPENDGVNRQHLEQLRKGPLNADMARLEQMSQVQQMTPAEYREAWAWVHLMLRGPSEGKATLLAYLQMLRTTPNAGPLQPRLAAAVPGLPDALDNHLQDLARAEAALR